jgi:uncharacterized protein involved in tolerance to divalent cations
MIFGPCLARLGNVKSVYVWLGHVRESYDVIPS